MPFFSSTKGYGLLWDSNAWSNLNPPTAEPINLTNSWGPSPAPFAPLSDGMQVTLVPCTAGSGDQIWRYDTATKAIFVNGSKELLDCDGCSAGHSPHLWHGDLSVVGNQQWDILPNGQIKSTQHTTCLGVSSHLAGLSSRGSSSGAVVMESCANGTTRWKMDPAGGGISLSSASRAATSAATCLAVFTGAKTASFTATADGDHFFYLDMCHGFGCGFNLEVYVAVTNVATGKTQVVVEWDKLTNLPNTIAGAARGLMKGTTYVISLVSSLESHGEKVYVVGPDAASKTVLRSNVGTLIDYYVTFSGMHSLDGAIKGYRTVTGVAPLYGKYAPPAYLTPHTKLSPSHPAPCTSRWAYGFWQCKEHYQHQDELLAAATRFRALGIPLDAIVQECPPHHCLPLAARFRSLPASASRLSCLNESMSTNKAPLTLSDKWWKLRCLIHHLLSCRTGITGELLDGVPSGILPSTLTRQRWWRISLLRT